MKKIKEEQSVIKNFDAIDNRLFENIVNKSNIFKETQFSDTEMSLYRDIFGAYSKHNVETKDQVLEESQINKGIVDNYLITDDYIKDHEYTKGNHLLSALYMKNSMGALKSISDEANKKHDKEKKKLEEKMKQQQKALKEAQKKLQDLINSGSDQSAIDEAAGDVAYNNYMANNLQGEVNNIADKVMKGMVESIKQATKESSQKAKDEYQVIKSFSDEADNPNNTADELVDYLDISNSLSQQPMLKDTLKLAGQLKEIVNRKKKAKSKDVLTRKGLEMGNDISRVLTTELALTSNPKTKRIFTKKFAEKQLMQYQTKGKKRLGQGPIVVCIDISGSMRACDISYQGKSYTRMVFAKAVAFAFYQQAKIQKRKMHVIEFDNKVQDSYEVSDKKVTSINKLLDAKGVGGTNFVHPMNKALSIIETSKHFKKADIIFITDGNEQVSDENKFKLRKKIRNLKTNLLGVSLTKDNIDLPVNHITKYTNNDDFTDMVTHTN